MRQGKTTPNRRRHVSGKIKASCLTGMNSGLRHRLCLRECLAPNIFAYGAPDTFACRRALSASPFIAKCQKWMDVRTGSRTRPKTKANANWFSNSALCRSLCDESQSLRQVLLLLFTDMCTNSSPYRRISHRPVHARAHIHNAGNNLCPQPSVVSGLCQEASFPAP